MSPTVSFLYHVGVVLVFCGAGAALLFVVLYTLLAPWWRSWIGRSLVGLAGTVFLALGLTACNVMGWTRPLGVVALLSIEVAVFALIFVVLIVLTVVLVHTQTHGRRVKEGMQ